MAEKNDHIVELIAHWSSTFGLPVRTEEKFADAKENVLAMSLIKEELHETLDALDLRDFKEFKDGLGDLLWVVTRAMMVNGINPLETISSIYDSNMSKADYTDEDALATKKVYNAKGITTYARVMSNGAIITYNADTNKVLKSHNFKTPKL